MAPSIATTARLLTAVLLLSMTLAPPAPGVEPTRPGAGAPKRVLTLYWYGKDFVANVIFDRRLQTAFRSAPGRVESFAEYLESNRFPGEHQNLALRDYLHRKYADHPVDVIIAFSATSLDFLLRYRDELFPQTPIVFHTFTRPELGDEKRSAGITGIIADRMFANTLDLALRLHPATKEVLIIVQTPERDKTVERQVRQELQGFEKRTALTYLSDLALAPMLARAKSAAEGTIIFYVRQSQDEPGNNLDPADVLSLVANSARVPIYSIGHEFLLGRGTVGGYNLDIEACAAKVAEVALRVADGASPRDIPIAEFPTTPRFDWHQLRRWHIDLKRLPIDSVILFQEPGIWTEYKWYIVAVGSVFVLQTALVAGLLVQRMRRRRSEAALRVSEERFATAQADLAHLGRISAMGELTASIAHEVNQPLGAVVTNAEACLQLLDGRAPATVEVREALADIVQDAHRASDVLDRTRALLKNVQPPRVSVSINSVILDALTFARRRVQEGGVVVDADLSANLPVIHGDLVGLQQVLVNLVNNAVEAMNEVTNRPRVLVIASSLDEAGAVHVSVRDSGGGIPPELVQRVFDTFYTTKADGMGMGLSVSRSIVEAHGGWLRAVPNGEYGATFEITLPP